jgi:hypothetical protein
MHSFGVTFDYRCPFARNLHEHLLDGLRGGAAWDVRFWAFSLNQVHVGPGELDVWDDPAKTEDLLAMLVGIAVRDSLPERFFDVHRAIFSARHDHGRDLRDRVVLGELLNEQGVAADEVLSAVEDGGPLATFRAEHELAANRHSVFGVPTLIAGEFAAFVRVMDRPQGDAARATATIERLLTLVTECPGLNELKHTTVPR